MAHRLACRLLGAFQVDLDGRPVDDAAWRRNRAKALVKLLALADGHRLHRELCAESLWPDLDADAAAANLRKAVHFARQALEPEHLVVRDAMIRLVAPDLWVDVDAFEEVARAGDLRAAIELYGGDLLVEDRFEPWTEPRREQLRVRHCGVLLDRARELERRDELRQAVELLERLTQLDPLHEEAHGDLMRAQALSGHRAAALRVYERLADRLRDELGVAPALAVRRIRDRVEAGLIAPPAPPLREVPPDVPAPVPLAEERRLVTVLVAAFPPVGGDPELVRRRADADAELALAVVRHWGGSAQREPAGGLLGVFGVPAAGEDDPVSALRAALELVERLPAIRVGVETGEAVVVTATGSLAGHPLDRAIQLRDAAAEGTALAGPQACRLAGSAVAFGEPTSMGAVAGRPPTATVGTARRRPAMPFAGRDAELNALLALWAEAADTGRPRVVTVVGAAGIGKSRLVAEAIRAAGRRYTVLRGRCLPRGQSGVYSAFGDLLRAAAGVSLDLSADEARARLGARLAELLAPLGLPGGEHALTLAALAFTAGVRLDGDDPLAGLPPAEVADELGRAWPRFATACAYAKPTLLVVEDLHWAGPQLLDMLERMAGRCAGPVVLVGTARPELLESRPGYGSRGEGSALITLAPLTAGDSRGLMDGLRTGWAAGVADARAERLLDRAEGNPYFLEELVAHVVDGVPGDDIPYTLHAVLAARIDALPPLERRVLQEAAVVGRTFWSGAVEHSLGLKDLGRPLLALEGRGLLLTRPASSLAGQAEYAFKHALVREVAYASLTRARRARAHASAGFWIEALAGDRAEEFAELLGYHYAAAADPHNAALAWDDPAKRAAVRARAHTHLVAAGTAARRRFALARAIELHTQALELAADDTERLAALEALGDDHTDAFHGDAADEHLLRALDLARADPGRAAARSRLCWKVAWIRGKTPGSYRRLPDPRSAEALVDEGLAAATEGLERAHLVIARGACTRLWWDNDPYGHDATPLDERIEAVAEAIATAEAAGEYDLVHDGHWTLTTLYDCAGRHAEMLDVARRQLAGMHRLRSRVNRADVLRRLGVLISEVAGDFTESLHYGMRSLALTRDCSPHQVMHSTAVVIEALFHLGRWDELAEFAGEHARAFAENPAVECASVRDGLVVPAIVHIHRGQARRAAELAELVGDPLADPGQATPWQARYATAIGDPATARVISARLAADSRTEGRQHALAVVEAIEAMRDWPALAAFLPAARAAVPSNALLEPFCDRAEGRAYEEAGRHEEARALIARAVAGFERMRVPVEAARTRAATSRAR